MSDGENSADPRYRGRASCVASFQLRRVSGGFVSSRVRCHRSAGRMRVCQIRIGRFRQGSGMLYLRNQIRDLQTGLAHRNGYGCFACCDTGKGESSNLRQGYLIAGFLQGALFRAMVSFPQNESSVYPRYHHHLRRNQDFRKRFSFRAWAQLRRALQLLRDAHGVVQEAQRRDTRRYWRLALLQRREHLRNPKGEGM